MRIAIFGGTSQIAKDFTLTSSKLSDDEIVLFSRKTDYLRDWLEEKNIYGRYSALDYADLETAAPFDAIMNFVGVGDPAKALQMGAAIFEVTAQYDQLALNYLNGHTKCRYIFMSSGAAYLCDFKAPADINTMTSFQINQIQQSDWYGISKIHAEAQHRANSNLPIVDIRIFNYFSHTQDMNASYFVTQVAQAISKKTVLKTSPNQMVRDFLHPLDFCQLALKILQSPATNCAVDAYSRAPIDKMTLLEAIKSKFGLQYQILSNMSHANATGIKPLYYSMDRSAARFGYVPEFTSLDALESELSLFLKKQGL